MIRLIIIITIHITLQKVLTIDILGEMVYLMVVSSTKVIGKMELSIKVNSITRNSIKVL